MTARAAPRSLKDRFEEHLAASGLIPEGTRVLVGFSGGADSTCLLHLLAQAGIDVVAAHLNHMQRTEADGDEESCRTLAERLGVPFVSEKADVPAISRDFKVGLEEAGRQARYEFFERTSSQFGCSRVATAHTLDDLVETVLLNLARGSGMRGLRGIPESSGKVVRPLLPFRRRETQGHCADLGVAPLEDPTNFEEAFARARVRMRVIPELESIHEGASEAIARMAADVAEEDEFLDAAAAAALERCEVPLNGSLNFLTSGIEAEFDAALLARLPAVILRRAVRLSTRTFGFTMTRAHTRTLMQSLSEGAHGSFTSEGGHVAVEWEPGRLRVRTLAMVSPMRHEIQAEGETRAEAFGWRFVSQRVAGGALPTSRACLEVDLPLGPVREPLHFRAVEAGDRMKPLGFQGSRKIADLLSEAKLTSAARSRIPVVCDMIGPVWVPGVCVDDRVREGSPNAPAIRLKFEAAPRFAEISETRASNQA